MSKQKQRILGIDPGYGRIGFGVVEGKKNEFDYVAHGCIETSQDLEFSERLMQIKSAIDKITIKYDPHISSVEELFFYKNVTTGIDVGQARGVILLTLAQQNLEIREYTPMQIKKALTGTGNANKKQVQRMVKVQLSLDKKPKQDDAADALAVALCAGFTKNFG